MVVVMFQPRFADKVSQLKKRQTIRPRRKLPIHFGDVLSLRRWSGKPYRSPQITLRENERCRGVLPVVIYRDGRIRVDGQLLDESARDWFAQQDGFETIADLLLWFSNNHAFPFYGDLISW